MSEILGFFQQFPKINLMDFLDVAIVAFLIYIMLPIFRSTGTSRIAWVVAGILAASGLTKLLKLNTLSYILDQVLSVGLIALIVLFQPELRRMLDHVTSLKIKDYVSIKKPEQEMNNMINQIVRACDHMSQERVGALIVIGRDSRLEEYFKTGTMIDAQVSEHLLRNIFFPKAALHDGAVIIREGRIAAAGCVLPLSDSHHISADLGTRHRASVGISEVSDAVTVVVSEETGAISVAVGGVLKRHLAPETLTKLLRNELCREKEQTEDNLVLKLYQKLQKKGGKGDEK